MLMTGSNAIKVKNGTKTQTRRCQGLEDVNWNPNDFRLMGQENGLVLFRDMEDGVVVKCKPRYKVGDIVPIREPHYQYGVLKSVWRDDEGLYRCTFIIKNDSCVKYTDNPPDIILHSRTDGEGWYLRPSLFMLDYDVRTYVRITGVVCGRVQDITPEDCIAEGVTSNLREHDACVDLKQKFFQLWDSINGKLKKNKPDLSWVANPWVFAYKFEVVK